MSPAHRRAAAAAVRLESQPLPAAVIDHHRSVRLAEAEAIYRQVLAATPLQPDALHLLGVVAYQTERHALAVHLIGLALKESPNTAMYHAKLGNALNGLGRPGQAIDALQRAVVLDSASSDYLYNLGLALHAAVRPVEAEARYEAAIGLRPSFVEAHDSLGALLREQGRISEAVVCHRAALWD